MSRFARMLLVPVLLLSGLSAVALADGPTVPDGFQIAAAAAKVHHPTRLAFGPDGRLYVAQQTGEILAITLENGKETARQQVAMAKLNVLGLTFRGDDLYIADPGVISRYRRQPDGTYANRQELVRGLPNGRHQTDGLAFGPDGKLYFGQGSTTDTGPETDERAGSIMRMNPDGTGVEIYARGLRNPYGITFTPDGSLWATDNGQDNPPTQDELNHIVAGGNYGWPDVVNMPPAGSKTVAPVLLLGDHNSTDGLTYYSGSAFPAKYRGGFFLAEWGGSEDETIGRAVGFARVRQEKGREVAEHEVFARGFNRPLDVLMGPQGDLWVTDFFGNTVYRIWYAGSPGGGGKGPAEGSTPGAGGSPGRGQPPSAAPAPPPAGPEPATPGGSSGVSQDGTVGVVVAGAAAVGLVVVLVLRRRSGR